jgi:hypothetical protein
MPAIRKPSNVLDAKGAFKHDPNRKRVDVEGVGAMPDPPETLNDLERELWFEIIKMIPPGVATGSDALQVEITARYWAKLRNTLTGDLTAAQIAQMASLCSALGMTPQGRTKIPQAGKQKKNSFDGF